MKVLIACEFSGVVRNAFLDRGHDAWSCDLMPALVNPSRMRHLRQDVRPLLKQRWDLVIAHPPCTYLSKVGISWLYKENSRWRRMVDGCEFFIECLWANSDKTCVENPVMHRYARDIVIVPPTQIIQPHEFGHPETKKTCLWLRGLLPLQPTRLVDGRKDHMDTTTSWKGSGKIRQLRRSITFQGIADAMADQWGNS